MSAIHKEEKKENIDMLLEIIRCTRYLARQRAPLRGPDNNEEDGNFIQLLVLMGEKDDLMKMWLSKRKIMIMALFVLRKIAVCIARSRLYTIMGDEVTDCGNKEQFVICMRWINDNPEAVESFIGLYNVDNIKADTLVAAISKMCLYACLVFTRN